MCEILLCRRANVNRIHVRGNAALHFANAYDKEGLLGEMLICKGGDDNTMNVGRLTCYEGLGE